MVSFSALAVTEEQKQSIKSGSKTVAKAVVLGAAAVTGALLAKKVIDRFFSNDDED